MGNNRRQQNSRVNSVRTIIDTGVVSDGKENITPVKLTPNSVITTNDAPTIETKKIDYDLINQQIQSCYNQINSLQNENSDLGSIKINLDESCIHLKQFLEQYKNYYVIDNETVNHNKYLTLYNNINAKVNEISSIISTNNKMINDLYSAISRLQGM